MQCSDCPGPSHLPTLELRQKVNSSRSLCTQSREGGCSYQGWQKFLNYKNTYKYTYADRKQRAFKEITEDRSRRELFTHIWGELREINKVLSSTLGLAPVEGHYPPPGLNGRGHSSEGGAFQWDPWLLVSEHSHCKHVAWQGETKGG